MRERMRERKRGRGRERERGCINGSICDGLNIKAVSEMKLELNRLRRLKLGPKRTSMY
jgi:hypothetical protein